MNVDYTKYECQIKVFDINNKVISIHFISSKSEIDFNNLISYLFMNTVRIHHIEISKYNEPFIQE